MIEASESFFQFMVSFYKIFPQFLKSELYLSGESFAGVYIPYFAKYIQDSNRKGEIHVNHASIWLIWWLNLDEIEGNADWKWLDWSNETSMIDLKHLTLLDSLVQWNDWIWKRIWTFIWEILGIHLKNYSLLLNNVKKDEANTLMDQCIQEFKQNGERIKMMPCENILNTITSQSIASYYS